MAVHVPVLSGQRGTANRFNTRLVEELMEWTSLASLGAFTANFSVGSVTPRMRIVREAGTTYWEYEGRINASAFAVNTSHTMFTFSSTNHRPLAERGTYVYGAGSSHWAIRLGLMTNGNLVASVPTGAGSPTIVWLDNVRFSNPK